MALCLGVLGRRSGAIKLGCLRASVTILRVEKCRCVNFSVLSNVASYPASCCEASGRYDHGQWVRDASRCFRLNGRYFGSKSRVTRKSTPDDDSDVLSTEDRSLLYSRSPSRRTYPRFLLGMTTIHTVYWLWYVLDFTPTLNAAAVARAEALASAKGATAAEIANAVAAATLDPTVGYAGLVLGVIMSVLAVAYPRHLVSEIRRGEVPGSLRIKVYDLPFVTIPKGEGELYTRGTAKIDNDIDVKKVVNGLDRNISAFRGHLGINVIGSRGNLLLNVGEGDKFERETVLLRSLLPPGKGGTRKAALDEDGTTKKRGTNESVARRKMKQRK